MAMMRWGMPPPRMAGPLVTNIRNTASPHWRIWLRPAVSCPSIETKEKDVFAHGDDRPLSSFAGVFL